MTDTAYPNIFRIKTNQNEIATGFLINSDGYIFTVAHIFNGDYKKNVKCENIKFKFEAELIYKSENEDLDFAILKAEDSNIISLINPLSYCCDDIADNTLIFGYGYGEATEMHNKNPKFDELELTKFGGKVALGKDYTFDKIDNLRYVVEGDSGAPIFDETTRMVIGITYERYYAKLKADDVFRGVFLPFKKICEYLKECNFTQFDIQKNCKLNVNSKILNIQSNIPKEQLVPKEIANVIRCYDYKEIRDSFLDFFKYHKRNSGVFIIHGQHGNGQRWIAKQLLSFKYINNANIIGKKSESTFNGFIEDIREDISSKEGEKNRNGEDISAKINYIRNWILNKKDHIIFPFCNFFANTNQNDIVTFFNEFFEQFWLPLLKDKKLIEQSLLPLQKQIKDKKLIEQLQKQIKDKKLIIFFIEENEFRYNSEFIVNDFRECKDSSVLLLPKLNKDTDDMANDLYNWIANHVKTHDDESVKEHFTDFYTEKDCIEYINKHAVGNPDALLASIHHKYDIPLKEL